MPWIRPVPVTVSPSGPAAQLAPSCAEHGQDLAGRLAGHGRPVQDRHAPAGDQRRGQERGRIDQIRLNGDRVAAERPRVHEPGVRVGRPAAGRAVAAAGLHRGPGVAQHLHGHRDVRGGRGPRAAVPDLQALLVPGRGQQQPGHQLGRGGGVHGHRAAGQRAGAVHGERDGAAAAVVDDRAELAQRGDDRADRPLRGPRVAVELRRDAGQRGHRRHETHHRAGVAHVDARVLAGPARA